MRAIAYILTGLTLAAAWLGAWVAARDGHRLSTLQQRVADATG